jgi:glycosyltransferase involved in cell wall biosynthesis
VRTGFDAATGDVLMVLDADMAVPPEELTRFVEPIIEGKAEAANGTRMVYPQEKQAMKQLHYVGNKMFSMIFTWLMGQYITDTLCGTKAILRGDYRNMKMGKDPWGDFDILIGIAKLGLRMAEIPVHYKTRRSGESKMRAFRHGLILLGRSLDGFMELKLRPRLKSMFGGESHG